jgi:transcriptional regulator with XRE-family HTH domain
MSNPDAVIGAAVRDARRELGLTQQQLARLAGVSGAAVERIESGAGMLWAQFVHLATILHIDLDALDARLAALSGPIAAG